jgi:hypothetical protein
MQAVREAGRSGAPAAMAAVAVVVLLALLPAAAGGARYAPPGDRIFTGVSDTGRKQDYFDFAAQANQHIPVMQSFETWGTWSEDARQAWKRTETRGMLSISTSPCYLCKEVISPREIRRGGGDGYLLTLNRELADWDRPTYIRLLPEMNGHWNPYAAFNQDGSTRGADHRTSQFRKAWQRSVLIVRGGPRKLIDRRLRRLGMPPIRAAAHPPGLLPSPQVGFLWVPQTAGSPDIPKNEPRAYWPGAKYVDWVGADIYGKFPNFTGLDGFYDAYKRKPFVIGEWSPWDYDNPSYTEQLFHWVEHHRRAKMMVYFQGFGDPNPFQIQGYPASAEMMRKQMRNPRYIDRAGDTHKPSGDGHTPTGPDGVPMPREWRQILRSAG